MTGTVSFAQEKRNHSQHLIKKSENRGPMSGHNVRVVVSSLDRAAQSNHGARITSYRHRDRKDSIFVIRHVPEKCLLAA